MSSRLFISRLSSNVSQSRTGSRWFSSSLAGPYLTLGCRANEDVADDGSRIANTLLIDAANEKMVTLTANKIPKVLIGSNFVGSCSLGWGILSEEGNDSSLWMNDFLNQSKIFALPPLTIIPGNLAQVAMSSDSPSEEEDCVVALKFLGTQISLCRPHDRKIPSWTKLILPFSCSSLTFSERDERFYLPIPGGNFLCSLDLHFKEDDEPQFHELVFRNLPELSRSEYQMLDTYSMAEHLVESSSTGEGFLVKWYSYLSPFAQRRPMFMVFREEETLEGKYMCYTEDIRDLCIFLSDSQPFCVEASSYPALKPNSIYFVTQTSVCVYKLSTRSYSNFAPPTDEPIELTFNPFWVQASPI